MVEYQPRVRSIKSMLFRPGYLPRFELRSIICAGQFGEAREQNGMLLLGGLRGSSPYFHS